MKFRIIFALLMLSVFGGVAHSQAQIRYNGLCSANGLQVTTQGLKSTGYFESAYPRCLVRVFVHGSSTLAPITTNGTVPLPNPFTAEADASFAFYASNTTHYDITMSGAGMVTTTISDVALPGAGGGGILPQSAPLQPGNALGSYDATTGLFTYTPASGGGGAPAGSVLDIQIKSTATTFGNVAGLAAIPNGGLGVGLNNPTNPDLTFGYFSAKNPNGNCNVKLWDSSSTSTGNGFNNALGAGCNNLQQFPDDVKSDDLPAGQTYPGPQVWQHHEGPGYNWNQYYNSILAKREHYNLSTRIYPDSAGTEQITEDFAPGWNFGNVSNVTGNLWSTTKMMNSVTQFLNAGIKQMWAGVNFCNGGGDCSTSYTYTHCNGWTPDASGEGCGGSTQQVFEENIDYIRAITSSSTLPDGSTQIISNILDGNPGAQRIALSLAAINVVAIASGETPYNGFTEYSLQSGTLTGSAGILAGVVTATNSDYANTQTFYRSDTATMAVVTTAIPVGTQYGCAFGSFFSENVTFTGISNPSGGNQTLTFRHRYPYNGQTMMAAGNCQYLSMSLDEGAYGLRESFPMISIDATHFVSQRYGYGSHTPLTKIFQVGSAKLPDPAFPTVDVQRLANGDTYVTVNPQVAGSYVPGTQLTTFCSSDSSFNGQFTAAFVSPVADAGGNYYIQYPTSATSVASCPAANATITLFGLNGGHIYNGAEVIHVDLSTGQDVLTLEQNSTAWVPGQQIDVAHGMNLQMHNATDQTTQLSVDSSGGNNVFTHFVNGTQAQLEQWGGMNALDLALMRGNGGQRPVPNYMVFHMPINNLFNVVDSPDHGSTKFIFACYGFTSDLATNCGRTPDFNLFNFEGKAANGNLVGTTMTFSPSTSRFAIRAQLMDFSSTNFQVDENVGVKIVLPPTAVNTVPLTLTSQQTNAGNAGISMTLSAEHDLLMGYFGPGNGAGLAGTYGFFDQNNQWFSWNSNQLSDFCLGTPLSGGNVAACTGAPWIFNKSANTTTLTGTLAAGTAVTAPNLIQVTSAVQPSGCSLTAGKFVQATINGVSVNIPVCN